MTGPFGCMQPCAVAAWHSAGSYAGAFAARSSACPAWKPAVPAPPRVALSKVARPLLTYRWFGISPLKRTPGSAAARRCSAVTARSLSLREAASGRAAVPLSAPLPSVNWSRARLFCIVAAACAGDCAPAASAHLPVPAANGAPGPADTLAGCTPCGRAVRRCVNDAAVAEAGDTVRSRDSVAAGSGATGCGGGV